MTPVVRFAIPFLGVLAIGAFNAWLRFAPVELSPVIVRADASQTNIPKDDSPASIARAVLSTTETYSRPLFDPRRHEVPVAATANEPALADALPVEPKEPPAGMTAPNIELIGISLAGSDSKALIKQGRETNADWYGMGANVNGWRLEKISSSSVSVVNGDQKLTFDLYTDAQPNDP